MADNDKTDYETGIESGDRQEKLNIFGRIALFLRQVIAELKKVIVPTRSELIRMTVVVLAFVVLMIVIVWGLDQFFGWLTIFVFGGVTGG